MKVTLLVFLFSCCVTFYACGPANNAVPAVAASTLSESDAREFQLSDTAKCLSLEKTYGFIGRAKQSRETVTDIRIIEDGAPVSPAFVSSVVSNTVLNVSQLPSDGPSMFRQNGCESISMLDAHGHEVSRLKLIQATATRLVTEKYSFKGGSEEPVGYAQTTIELLNTHQTMWRTTLPYTTSHDKASCGIEQENHEVAVSSLIEFGERLGGTPLVSDRLTQLEARSQAYKDPANAAGGKKDEALYCTQATKI